jgi:hypothetical protein
MKKMKCPFRVAARERGAMYKYTNSKNNYFFFVRVGFLLATQNLILVSTAIDAKNKLTIVVHKQ